MTDSFACRDCGQTFSLSAATLARYPNWTPTQCIVCRKGNRRTRRTAVPALDSYDPGPQGGIFTDGGCDPNPGPGGWGAVKVLNGEIVEERHGNEPRTTNNQMELRALIEAFGMIDERETISIYSDSVYCVKTINIWAAEWEKKGWTRSRGGSAVKNLDLVQQLYTLKLSHPRTTVEWLKGHAGYRWNEYADALASRWKSEDNA